MTQDDVRRRLRWVACAAVLVGWLVPCAQAGVTAQTSGSCGSDAPALPDARPKDIAIFGGGPSAPDDLVMREVFDEPSHVSCVRETRIHPYNETDAPAVGATEALTGAGDERAQEVIAAFVEFMANAAPGQRWGSMPRVNCSAAPCPVPALLMHSAGFQLSPASGGGFSSKGAYAFFQRTRLPGEPSALSIPFVVEKAHDGDVLELSWRGSVFFRAPVDSLTIGELYWVPVPESVLSSPAGVLGLFINTSVGSNSTVYFPTAALSR